MKEASLCERHEPRAHIVKPNLPPELLCVPQAVMPLIILGLYGTPYRKWREKQFFGSSRRKRLIFPIATGTVFMVLLIKNS